MDIKIYQLVKLILSNVKNSEEKKSNWASFKNTNAVRIGELLSISSEEIKNPGSLINVDFDDDNSLMIMNYTSQAHNTLHNHDCGWSEVLKQIRGLVFDISNVEDPVLISRSFEKFFNLGELKENTYESLCEKYGEYDLYEATEKADGHMIQYFVKEEKLYATTRGKFKTISAEDAYRFMSIDTFNHLKEFLNNDLMSIVVELVTNKTRVHVDYKGKESIYLLALYNSKGEKYESEVVSNVLDEFPEVFSKPVKKLFSLSSITKEINKRSVKNNEGWVINFNGELIKFKYIDYIGKMVEGKLSFKYLMSCIINDRLDKMLFTLPEELRKMSYEMVKKLQKTTAESILEKDHKILYSLYSDIEGGKQYFRTVCRKYFKSQTAES